MMLPAQPHQRFGSLAPLAFLAAPFPDIELLIPATLAGLGAAISPLAEYIARMEGYQVSGSIAQRNNNPGNLRSGSGQVGTASGFAVFPSAEAGWAALDRQIALDARRGLNLQQFVYKYAPPSENDSANYLNYISSSLGVDPNTPLSVLQGSGSPWDDSSATTPLGTSEESLQEAETGESEAQTDSTGLLLAAGAAVAALALLA